MFEDPVLKAHLLQFVLDMLAVLAYFIRTRIPRGTDRRKHNV